MRLPAWSIAVALWTGAGRAHAEPRVEADETTALVAQLSSGGAETRRAAADRIADLGYDVIEGVARRSAGFDAATWQAFADACVRKAWSPDACALVGAAHAVPPPGRQRVLDLARRLDSWKERSPEEVTGIVHRLLVQERGLQCDSFWQADVAIHGHAGVPAILRLLGDPAGERVDLARAGRLLELVAQEEDLPALRELLLGGKTIVAAALGRLQMLGVPGAAGILNEAVAAGQFDQELAAALYGNSFQATRVRRSRGPNERVLRGAAERDVAVEAIRAWSRSPGRTLGDRERTWIATVFAALDSRDDVPTLERWVEASRDADTILSVAKALTRLGSRKGVEALVRVVGAQAGDAPPPPADSPEARRARWAREDAAQYLGEVDAEARSPIDSRGPGGREPGPWADGHGERLDRVAREIVAWWAASRDALRFDGVAGRWRVERS